MTEDTRKLYGFSELKSGTEIVSIETIPTETQIMASQYLCMIVMHDGEEKRVIIPVAKIIQARPYTSEILRICANGNEFFSIQEIAARDRGEPFVLELDHEGPTTMVEWTEENEDKNGANDTD